MEKRLNAVKTGAYAQAAVLPWEKIDEFDHLRSEIFADLCPHGRTEEEIVEHIVENRWLRQRQRDRDRDAPPWFRKGTGKSPSRVVARGGVFPA